MNSDIEIAQSVQPQHIVKIANKLNIDENDLHLFGKFKAKLPLSLINEEKVKQCKLILVSAISPTPAGEGKTTTSIGLSEGLNRIGKKTTVVLREPSLGPVFGIKGGATGGGWSQVLPMEDINLHFTGDFGAIEKAHNLLAALIDNNIQNKKFGLGLDPRTIAWKRVMDMNDRSLRKITIGLGGTGNGIPRETGFDITAASEIMAILCLSKDLEDLKTRMGNIFIGYTMDRKPIYARDIKANGAMATLMKDAIRPNLVQTIEGNPAIIHGGPFANIAQGTNSIIATKMGMSLSDYVVTEAGFGFDLGAEKFLNIKCRTAGLSPNAVVIVATVRALKYHGGQSLKLLNEPNAKAVEKGCANLEKHLENAQQFGIPAVVAINRFVKDTDEELAVIKNRCEALGVEAVFSEVWAKGGEGAIELAEKVAKIADQWSNPFIPTYDWNSTVEEKINAIATKIYGAKHVEYSVDAKSDIKRINNLGLNKLPVCMAKTQKSLSDNPDLIGRPKDFTLTVRDIEIAAGAGFIVPITGEMMRMPGLPDTPAAESIDIDKDGHITGLF
ncbi:MAG: formate--tetrahydrofolate ligase [Saprospiraceae bacterium]|jgi:formate--tetrahydrofolate ligase|nr:formate--tetrahydrofolate ligase [Candidatus Defluviibacterium haderslevense]MBK7243724.1 formate--tetrahydrofolate ligase [Candidatus Defluviibacterium haderslevense]MCI1267404.1 formate--tetrahydrofolate ligase [Saprospiraceae bacterium]